MKKILLSIFFISAFLAVHAQSDDELNFYTNGGLGASWLGIDHGSASNISPKHPIVNFSIGMFADLKLPKSKHWVFNPGAYIVGTGGDYTGDDGYTRQLRLYNIQPSLNLTYNTPVKNGIFYIGGGPLMGLAFGGETRTYIPGESTKKSNLRPLHKGGDYHAAFLGAEAVIGLKTKSGYLLNITYDHGLTNVLRTNGNSLAGKEIKTRSIYFTIGHAFFD